jgi:DNA-binding response OmpR family regulator
MRAPAILLVDPDVWAVAPLEQAGYPVTHVATAAEARMHLRDAALLVMDLDLPDEDGVVLISEIRERRDVPILVCSARERRDVALALRFGADMVAEKPLAPAELVARVGAVLRRAGVGPVGSRILECGRLVIDLAGITVRVDGTPVHLTATEFRLLVVLAEAYGEVVPHVRVIEQVWGQPLTATLQHLINIHVSRIRAVLRPRGADRMLTNRPGVGYMLLDPDHEHSQGDS